MVGSWSTASNAILTAVGGQTVRMVVRVSIGGPAVRVHLSNAYGRAPVTFENVHLGRHGTGGRIEAGSNRPVTFGGRSSVTVPAGAGVWSDPLDEPVAGGEDVAISVYVPEYVQGVTGHDRAYATTYMSGPGDHAADESADEFTYVSNQWFFVDRLTVQADSDVRSVVALGDSLTDGTGQANDVNRRWTDFLHRRLVDASETLGVLNSGIAGNRVLLPTTGPSGLSRFQRDVLSQPGVRTVIVYEGINDIARGSYTSAKPLINGYKKLIREAHAKKLKVIGATLTPFRGAGSWAREKERLRQQVNHWIRTSGAFDTVVDFDRAVRRPGAPDRLAPAYDSGDHLHLSDAGRRKLAYTIPLREL
ncbi:SGNH hydrolase [Planotetraspora thailandica]|uniref:SGNH hydrolase n=2 Tax=Planotetraspora thailandica TaxID=487172 RepID=A0A8J4DFS2_9ACTN|nr:SGNH hydrolase [Planotetraspora thailandica]